MQVIRVYTKEGIKLALIRYSTGEETIIQYKYISKFIKQL